MLFDNVDEQLSNEEKNYNEILNSDLLDKVLDEGAEFTRKIAKDQLQKKRRKMYCLKILF